MGGILYPRLTNGWTTAQRDLHAVIGVWASLCILFLLLTGLPWANFWGHYFKAVRQWSGWMFRGRIGKLAATVPRAKAWWSVKRWENTSDMLEIHVGASTPVKMKDCCLPMMPCTTTAPSTEASSTEPSNRLFRSPMISSSTKVVAASVALKAAANPAAAPAAEAARRFCFASPVSPARLDASVPRICTLGPSRPRLEPPPTLMIPARNFTHATRHGVKPKSFQKASFSCGMPLPVASAQTELNSQPTSSDDPTRMPRLPNRKMIFD